MSSSQQTGNLLEEFDPLASPASDPAPSAPFESEKGDTETPRAAPRGPQEDAGRKETTPLLTSSQMADPVPEGKTGATPSSDSPAVKLASAAISEGGDTPTASNTAAATPTKATPDAVSSVTGSKDTPTDGGSSSSSKKKKKKKKHSSEKSSKRETKPKATTTVGKGGVGVRGHFSAQEINSEMNQIDQFLQSLRMGTYDPLNPQSAASAAPSASAPSTSLPPPSAGTPAKEGGGASTKEEVGGGASRSLGMQLIGQLASSSSSSDSWDSSSDSSDDEDSDDDEDTKSE